MRGFHLGVIYITILILVILSGCGNSDAAISISSAKVSIEDMYVDSQIVPVNADEEENAEAVLETEENESEAVTDIVNATEIKQAKPGDYVAFGNYEQDGDKGNGTEPIEWLVLDAEEDNILILSRYVIEKKAFNENGKANGWAQSTIRKWLNEEFLKSAFADREIEKIGVSKIDNPGSTGYFKEFGKKTGTAAGKKTEDKVFLLSYEEVLKFFEPVKVEKFGFYVGKDLITTATGATGLKNECLSAYDYDNLYKDADWPEDCVDVNGAGWFLRSNGLNAEDVMSVGFDGALRAQYYEYGADYESATYEGGVRPAMWIHR